MSLKLGIDLKPEHENSNVYRIRDRYILTFETLAYGPDTSHFEKPIQSDSLYTLMFENIIESENNNFSPSVVETSYIDRTIEMLGTIRTNNENQLFLENAEKSSN